MFKVNTPSGEKYMIQLVGPASYRMGNMIAYRGQTLTVTKKNRDYLVRKTHGAWVDFVPTPPEPVEEYMPPQFDDPGGPRVDMEDFDPKANPAMSLQHAMQLANGGGGQEVPTNQAGPVPFEEEAPEIDTADLMQKPEGIPEKVAGGGDMSSADLKGATAQGKGGATAEKKGGVVITAKAKPKVDTGAALSVE